MKGIIYEAINKINNKRYIGQTTMRLCSRKANHKTMSKFKNYAFSMAIRKYSWDNFEWKIIDHGYSQEELDNKEIFWIKFFHTYSYGGYNATAGGQANKYNALIKYGRITRTNSKYSRNVLIYDKYGNFIRTETNKGALAQELKVSSQMISKVLNGTRNSVRDYILFYEDLFTQEELERRIKQLRNFHDFVIFNAKTYECLGIWNNLSRCSEDTGITRRAIEKQIYNQVKGKPRKFIFKYIKDCTSEELALIN